MLSYSDKETILSQFPNIKLSYENIVYKKVYNADMNLAIPEGTKCFAWFTTHNNKNVCIIIELTENKQVNDIKITNACFSNELSYGTILYGTVFFHSGNKFFCIEDIFSFKGKNIEKENWANKLFIFKDLLKNHIKQTAYNNSFMVFGLPIITNNVDDMVKSLEKIKYKIGFIQFRSFNRVNNYLFMNYTSFKESASFKRNESIVEKVKCTNINTCKNICKNRQTSEELLIIKPDIQNALEESDDEEEFENEKEDKFVYLDKNAKMFCQYNYKFKKWVPVKLAEPYHKVALKKDLLMKVNK